MKFTIELIKYILTTTWKVIKLPNDYLLDMAELEIKCMEYRAKKRQCQRRCMSSDNKTVTTHMTPVKKGYTLSTGPR